VGQYDDALWNGGSVAGHPGLNLYVENHFSGNTAGSFRIYDLTFDSIGMVNSLAVTFDQYSDGNTAGLHGALWVNSLVDVPPAYTVAEPATYLLMFTGLGLLGFAVRKPDQTAFMPGANAGGLQSL
jgi:PEP-CTERM motif-containing protein